MIHSDTQWYTRTLYDALQHTRTHCTTSQCSPITTMQYRTVRCSVSQSDTMRYDTKQNRISCLTMKVIPKWAITTWHTMRISDLWGLCLKRPPSWPNGRSCPLCMLYFRAEHFPSVYNCHQRPVPLILFQYVVVVVGGEGGHRSLKTMSPFMRSLRVINAVALR